MMKKGLSVLVIAFLMPLGLFIGAFHSFDYLDMGLSKEDYESSAAVPGFRSNPSINIHPNNYFIENKGQLDDAATYYYAIGSPVSIAFRGSRVTYLIHEIHALGPNEILSYDVVFEGAHFVEPCGEEPYGHKTNCFFSRDSSEWVAGADNVAEVVYHELYDGIDLRYYFLGDELKYEFIIQPGIDPSIVMMRYIGEIDLSIEERTGNLIIDTSSEEIVDKVPFAYQSLPSGSQPIACNYRIIGQSIVGFDLGSFDKAIQLVIDPGLVFSTFIGGDLYEDMEDMVVDGSGAIYITGMTSSLDFPSTPGAYQKNLTNYWDAVIVKLDSSGRKLIYSTFVGGNNSDCGNCLKVDNEGNAYVIGETYSSDFPITENAFDTIFNSSEGFVLKLNPDGSNLTYSTYLGGSNGETGDELFLEPSGCVVVAGHTYSTDFPVLSGAYCVTNTARSATYLTKLSANGSSIIFSTFIGSNQSVYSTALEIDGEGRPTLLFEVTKSGFPTTQGAYDETYNGGRDILVVRMNSIASAIEYATFLGGSKDENPKDLKIDANGCVYVTGPTSSNNYPVTINAFDKTFNGNVDAFITKLDSNGTSLLYSTFVGANNIDSAMKLILDEPGNCYVVGGTDSPTFPITTDAYDIWYDNYGDAFMIKMDPSGSKLLYSTLIGDFDFEIAYGVGLDSHGCVIVAGITESDGFPVSDGSFDVTFNGRRDFFVVRLDIDHPWINHITTSNATTGDPFEINATISDNMAVSKVSLEYCYGKATLKTYVEMNITSGNSTNGTWVAKINVPDNSVLPLRYWVIANDTTGNSNSTLEMNKTVLDNDSPSLEDRTTQIPTTGDVFTFKVDLVDNINVTEVHVVYWYGASPDDAVNLTMSPQGTSTTGNGTWWNDTVQIPSNALAPLHYFFTARDGGGNWNGTGTTTVGTIDNDAPVMLLDSSNETGTTGDVYWFATEVLDNIGISMVNVTYWYGPADATNSTIPMDGSAITGLGNGTYECEIIVPADSIDALHYYFTLVDTSMNRLTTMNKVVTIFDDDRPTIVTDSTDHLAGTGNRVGFRTEVKDNIGISSVYLRYRLEENNSISWNVSMSGVELSGLGNGTYAYYGLVMPLYSIQNVTYVFMLLDRSGNWNQTSPRTILGVDDDPPELFDDTNNYTPTTGEGLFFIARALDNILVSEVRVVYWFGDARETERNVSMTGTHLDGRGNGTYDHLAEIPSNSTDDLSYFIIAMDRHGNQNQTRTFTRAVSDNDFPTIREDRSMRQDGPPLNFLFDVLVSDNINIENVQVEYSIDGEETILFELVRCNASEDGTWNYSRILPVNSPSASRLAYRFKVVDTSDNLIWSGIRNIILRDLQSPIFGEDSTPSSAIKGNAMTFAVEVHDDIGIELVTVEFWIGDGPRTTQPMLFDVVYSLSTIISRSVAGNLSYILHAEDTSGNVNVTPIRTVTLKNLLPTVRNIPEWTVTEEVTSRFDLSIYLSDGNDALSDLQLTCDSPNINIEGLTLVAFYSIWKPDHELNFSVGDGEDWVSARISIHVINVNDPPVISSMLPENGTRFLKGSSIAMKAMASDEDGDVLTYTWRSDGNVLGTGQELKYDRLTKGSHTVVLTVEDGNTSVTRSVNIEVYRDSFGTASISFVTVLIIAIVIIVIIVYRVRRRREAQAR